MDEFGGAQMGEARLSKRLIKLAERLGDAPSASIPGACNGHTETQGACRFFDLARADERGLGWESVLAPHMVRIEARMAECSVVLCFRTRSHWTSTARPSMGWGAPMAPCRWRHAGFRGGAF